MITKQGHKYKLNGKEFMVLEPQENLLKSTMIKKIAQSTVETFVADLNTGVLTIHRYPKLTEIQYLIASSKRAVDVWLDDGSIESLIKSVNYLFFKFGEGRVIDMVSGKTLYVEETIKDYDIYSSANSYYPEDVYSFYRGIKCY